ncbi:hypothetical protein PR048_020522 [Dryococelus australis]|uniref:Uncharacterized protein n=1 Tax=Dryococelus australis TaxID=614101 RepID=A0ABQ9H6H9_9NEOP|nr:hypothetical protein PR048_020522 [Dryococelus australis]
MLNGAAQISSITLFCTLAYSVTALRRLRDEQLLVERNGYGECRLAPSRGTLDFREEISRAPQQIDSLETRRCVFCQTEPGEEFPGRQPDQQVETCDNRTEHLPRRRHRGANPRPSDYKSATLPLSITPQRQHDSDKTDAKHMDTEVDFAIGSQFIRHAMDDSERIADLQGNNHLKVHAADQELRTFNSKRRRHHAPFHFSITQHPTASGTRLQGLLGLLKIYNESLSSGLFSIPWKKGSLWILHKEGEKDPEGPKSYRSLPLLPVLGKLINRRLTMAMEAEGTPKRETIRFQQRNGYRLCSA